MNFRFTTSKSFQIPIEEVENALNLAFEAGYR